MIWMITSTHSQNIRAAERSHKPENNFQPSSLDTPVLSAPPDGTTFSPVDGITLQWEAVIGATSYNIHLWGGDRNQDSGWITDTYVPAGPLPAGNYQWQVKAKNDAGESDWSPTWRFTVIDTSYNPVPYIFSIIPEKLVSNSGDSKLTLDGSGYVPQSAVLWNGKSCQTVYINSMQIAANILEEDISMVNEAMITVYNPEPGGGFSNSVKIMVEHRHTIYLSTLLKDY